MGYAESSRLIPSLKREYPFLTEVSSVPLQQSLRNLQSAYSAFFNKTGKYPRFKSKKTSRQSVAYTGGGFTYRNGQIKLAKMAEPLNIIWTRELPSDPSSVTISNDASGRWFVSFICEDTVTALPKSKQSVGIDVGLTTLLTLSTGEKIVNTRYEKRDRERLAKAQRELTRKQLGSHNRDKARMKVAKVYARISDRRRDHLHKISTRIIRENQTVVIEDLSVRNLLKNHLLARAISDASWSELRCMLEYKAKWYGRTIIAIDRFYPSSQLCSSCGALGGNKPLNVREWTCSACGALHDRDINAAKNILAAGLVVSACGEDVRLTA